ncbi:hypothetical protein ACMD2_02390 [Ananas comosus]|nr:hypothetical protein ACMD2_02390 [Ananas comosus]
MPLPLPSLSLLLLLLLLLVLVPASLSAGSAADDDDDPCAAPALSDGGGGASCPVTCFRPDPVCGADGVTYWCGCADAACAGARVAKRGFCGVASGGSGLVVSGQVLLLVHIVWLFLVGFAVLFGFL